MTQPIKWGEGAPGPWIDGHNVSHEPTVRSADPGKDNGGFIVATCHGPKARAHARAIAKLPEIVAALREMTAIASCIAGSFALRREYGWEKSDQRDLDAAEAVLAAIDNGE